MSETKHTPGPWLWRGKSGSLHRAGSAPYTYGDTVLEPSWEYDSGADTIIGEADSALIAAAPDLLEALDDCPNMDDFDTAFEFRAVFNQWWDKQALPAIEKAKGERS